MTSMKIKPMPPMVMTKEACQQDKTPFDLSNDFGPLRHSRTWERKKSKNVGTCVRNLRWNKTYQRM